MAFYRCGGGGIPSSLKTDMNAVFNKKFGTAVDYPAEGWPDDVNLLGKLPEKTASGSIVHITDGADEVPIKSWEVEIAPTLTGKSAIECTQTGKNLLPNKTYQRNANTLRIGTDTLDGRLSLKAGTYTLSITSNVVIGTMTYTIDGNSTDIQFTSSGTRYYGSFTLSADTDDIFIHVYKSGGITAENVSDFMLEVGSTATTYEPYTAPTVSTVNLGRTIYGGTADVVKGEGQDKMLRYELDENDSWSAYSGASHSFWHNVATGEDRPIKQTDASESICNYATYSSTSPSSAPDFSFLIQGGQRIVVTADSTIDTVDKFKTWLSSHNLVFVCPASTPTDFTFTPITPTPETALGVNNFWADEGDSEVTYRADINLALGGQ